VEFVRFVGDEVARLEIMKIGGQKVVHTEKEIDIKPPASVAQDQPVRPANAPTLRRPGEEMPDSTLPKTTPSGGTPPMAPPPPPTKDGSPPAPN
jgi:hypothetical protein